jgi:hypothetical protein
MNSPSANPSPWTASPGNAQKLGLREYRLPSGVTRRTSGTANVNGPRGDKLRAATVKAEYQRLNKIAQTCGFKNWYALERSALAGEKIVINN